MIFVWNRLEVSATKRRAQKQIHTEEGTCSKTEETFKSAGVGAVGKEVIRQTNGFGTTGFLHRT